MGYMGLDSWGESDAASEAFHCTVDVIIAQLTKELRNKNNEYNTSGPVNVALTLRALRPSTDLRRERDFEELCEKTSVCLELLVAEAEDKIEWDNEDNRKMHLKSYRKMLREVRTFYQKDYQ